MPRISIITVCLNDEQRIEETIRSVLSQTYSEIEYIIIDGGSTDGTLGIIDRYRGRIAKIVSEKDRGIYDAMNKGINLAMGEWLNFMNAGDRFYSSHTLADLIPDFLRAKDHAVLYGDLALKTHDPNLIRCETKPVEEQSKYKLIKLCHQSMFIRREAFLKYGLYDDTFQIAGDACWYNVVCRVKGEKRFFYKSSPICIFDITRGRSSDAGNFFKARKEARRVVGRIFGDRFLPRILFFFETILLALEGLLVKLFCKTRLYKFFRSVKCRRKYLKNV